MLHSNDGTPYSSETVRELIDNALNGGKLNELSAILGADWGANLNEREWAGAVAKFNDGDHEDMLQIVLQVARKVYADETGHLVG